MSAVISLLLLSLSFLSIKCQESYCDSIYCLPTTILPINYKLQLHPDIPNDVFHGIEFIEIEITDEYFNNTIGNFDVSFNFYPGMIISTVQLQVNGTDTGSYDLSEELETDDTTQIATATFNIPKDTIQTLLASGGNNFTLYMEYTGQIRGGNDLAGWYKSIYQYEGNDIINLVTQFQATDARSAFPCFDEPAFKATFDITFIAAVSAIKLSNMPPIGDPVTYPGVCTWTNTDGLSNDACEMVTFATTPEMSTYLLAFAIGGYNAITKEDSIPLQTVYYPYTFGVERAAFALEESVAVLDLFSGPNGFNISYEISTINKLDSIAVSDFAAGAMENWGLIVYRTVRLLVDETISSQASKSGQILIIAHELAHQWFGNLVSPQWWDDLWLNEGFATYMAFYGANIIQPGYNLNENKIQAITQVMNDDASVFTHSVKQYVEGDPTQILSSFSSITYQKGMGVINTIANVMGNTEFLGGISKYLEEYQFDVATSEELGAVLDEVSPDISLLMDSFISQEGFPLITIHTQVDQSDENEFIFTIDQRRFVKQGPDFYEDANYANNNPFVTQNMINNFASQIWRVPMVWRDANGDIFEIDGTENDIMIERELQSTKARIIREDGVEFYLVNPVDGGTTTGDGLFNFYRVFYDDLSFELLVNNWLHIGGEDQYTIISDRYALMQSLYITPEEYLDFIRNIADKMINNYVKGTDIPNYPIWNVIINSLIYIDDIFCELVFEDNTSNDKALRGYFRDLAITIIRRVLGVVVDNINIPFSDDHVSCPINSDCNILQSACLKALVRFDDRNVVTRAYEWYYLCPNRICTQPALCRGCNEPRIENQRLSINITDDVMQAFIAGVLSYNINNENTLNEILNLYDLVNIEQQTYILNALGAVYKSHNLIQKALDFIMSDKVRSNMKVNTLVGMKRCSGRNKLWQYVSAGPVGETVFDQLFTGSGLFSQEPLTSLGNTFASSDKQENVSLFFSQGDRMNLGTVRIVNQTGENIYSRYLWKISSQPSLELYMRTYIVEKLTDDFTIGQIILVTVFCCGGLICLVIAFWGVSRPTESDRFVYYLSKKRTKKERRKSSLSHHGAGQASLGQSLDRTIRTNTATNVSNDTGAVQGNKEIVEEQPPPTQQGSGDGSGGGGYGATEAYNYNKLKDDEQT